MGLFILNYGTGYKFFNEYLLLWNYPLDVEAASYAFFAKTFKILKIFFPRFFLFINILNYF